jgi:putative toxin-antitoxin system antitoxin component (TIGR02293 family)
MTGKLTRATDDNRVSELLGLPEEVDDQDTLRARVKNGLPVASVENVWEVMHSQPAHKIVSERAYRRAKAEKLPLSPVKSRVLYDFARAYVVADRIYQGNGALVMRFLEKPNPELGGASPMALAISSPAGADAVIELLDRPNEKPLEGASLELV